MQALIIDKQIGRLDHSLISLMKAGVQVTGTGSIHVAEICIQRMGVDLLVIDKASIGDALGDTLGMAEERNPHVVTILRTPDVTLDQDELTPHFASLHCVVGQDVPNSVAVKLGLASLRARTTNIDEELAVREHVKLAAPAMRQNLHVPSAEDVAKAYAQAM